MRRSGGASLHFRPFSSQVGERLSAREPKEMADICREMLDIRNGGTTALQTALEGSVQDRKVIDRGALFAYVSVGRFL